MGTRQNKSYVQLNVSIGKIQPRDGVTIINRQYLTVDLLCWMETFSEKKKLAKPSVVSTELWYCWVCAQTTRGWLYLYLSIDYLLLRHTSPHWGQDFPASYINQRRYRLADKPLGSCYTATAQQRNITPQPTPGEGTDRLTGWHFFSF